MMHGDCGFSAAGSFGACSGYLVALQPGQATIFARLQPRLSHCPEPASQGGLEQLLQVQECFRRSGGRKLMPARGQVHRMKIEQFFSTIVGNQGFTLCIYRMQRLRSISFPLLRHLWVATKSVQLLAPAACAAFLEFGIKRFHQ